MTIIDLDKTPYLHVEARVRYWEDAVINGETDEEGRIPCRKGDSWNPIIDLRTGRVADWPLDINASVHYKVCDQGKYWIADANGSRVWRWCDYYVPSDLLCVGDEGFGDYIILEIEDGQILEWVTPTSFDNRWDPFEQIGGNRGSLPPESHA